MFLNFLSVVVLSIAILQCVGALPAFDSSGSGKKLLRLAKSAEMRNYMNESIDPCEDFHGFACGNYRNLHPKTMNSNENSVFYIMRKAFENKIIKHLEGTDDVDKHLDRAVKNFYGSCVSFASRKTVYKKKLKEIASEFGKMPAMEGDRWNESTFDWIQTIGEISYKYDIQILVGSRIEIVNNASVLTIFIPPMGFATKEMYTDDEFVEYRKSAERRMEINMRIFLGLDKEVAQQTAKEIFEFESEYAIAVNTQILGYNPKANKTSIIDLIQYKYAPELNMMKFLAASFGEIPSERIYNTIEAHPESIRSVLRKTSKRIMANYINYHLLKKFMFNGGDIPNSCLLKTREYFPNYVDYMIFSKYNDNHTIRELETLWNDLKADFEETLKVGKIPCLEGEALLKKLENIKLATNSYLPMDFIEHFNSIAIDKDDYVNNLKTIFSLRALLARKKLSQTQHGPEGNAGAAKELPYLINNGHKIIVPVALLQPFYLWSNSYSNALKFSTLGVLLSQELMHILGSDGQYQKCSLGRHLKCFAEQNGNNFNGDLQTSFLAKNIPDSVAIRLAYSAYAKWLTNTTKDQSGELMPRLDYTSKQLFFISYGQMVCSESMEIFESVFGFPIYLIDKNRINGPISSVADFSKDFKCPYESAMNPIRQCENY